MPNLAVAAGFELAKEGTLKVVNTRYGVLVHEMPILAGEVADLYVRCVHRPPVR